MPYDESIDGLRSAAADVINHYTVHSDDIKRDAIGAVASMLDLAA
jgi:hypothetical protein